MCLCSCTRTCFSQLCSRCCDPSGCLACSQTCEVHFCVDFQTSALVAFRSVYFVSTARPRQSPSIFALIGLRSPSALLELQTFHSSTCSCKSRTAFASCFKPVIILSNFVSSCSLVNSASSSLLLFHCVSSVHRSGTLLHLGHPDQSFSLIYP